MPTDPDSQSTSKSPSNPPEIEAVRAAIRAARESNLAAIRALEVVEAVFSPRPEPTPQVVPDLVSDLIPEGCQHEEALTLQTATGTYVVCPCGEQRLVG